MEIGIVADHMRPALDEISALFPIKFEWIAVDAAGRRLMVDECGFRGPEVCPSFLHDTQAEIDVIEVDRQVLGIEATDCFEF
jgi:hypothetical protein